MLPISIDNASITWYNIYVVRRKADQGGEMKGGRNMDEMANASEVIERLARESERQKVKLEQLEKENNELKERLAKAEAELAQLKK